eukprot:g42798.t1
MPTITTSTLTVPITMPTVATPIAVPTVTAVHMPFTVSITMPLTAPFAVPAVTSTIVVFADRMAAAGITVTTAAITVTAATVAMTIEVVAMTTAAFKTARAAINKTIALDLSRTTVAVFIPSTTSTVTAGNWQLVGDWIALRTSRDNTEAPSTCPVASASSRTCDLRSTTSGCNK